LTAKGTDPYRWHRGDNPNEADQRGNFGGADQRGNFGGADQRGNFEAFYVANHRRLVIAVYAYVGDLAQAQDLVQEAFARALPRWDRLSTYDDPLAWVRRVAWNLATSRWRQLRRLDLLVARHRPEPVPEPSSDRVDLNAALATLAPRLRRALVMHYLADMSVVEIAAHELVAVGTVKSWLHRGRAALAAALTDQREENSHA
jgi:RNA polymerase sigma-70 factor (ECF subfamily)